MHDFARRTIDIARWGALLSLAVVAAAQDVLPPPRYAEVDALAVRALDAKDPVTRGEAALWLADSGKHEHYEAILRAARDPIAPARHRGILAAARLQAPGCESFLGRLLADMEPDSAEAMIAAFGLGQLADNVPTPAIDDLLGRAQGGSKKRYHALFAALLGGLATGPHPSRAAMVRGLLEDASNRSEAITLLALAALQAQSTATGAPPFPRAQVTTWLEHRHAGVRAAALGAWAAQWRPTDVERPLIVRLTRSDPDALVRAAALRLLARLLDDRAVDLADRALTSRFAVEAAAAASTLLTLAGTARRERVEDHLLEPTLAAPLKAAVLDVLTAPLPPRLLLWCHDTAHDADAVPILRVASAMALARADSVLATTALRAVFFAIDDEVALEHLAAGLLDEDALTSTAAQLTGPEATAWDAAAAARLRAIARADAALGTDVFLELATHDRLRDAALGQALAALRAGRVRSTSPAVLAFLPAAVAALAP